jgi:carboxypeptidase C (cathepsin A)
MAKLFYNY